MLQNCNTLMLKKSLDIPWINTVVYIAAMFTTLFISAMRKDQLSPGDLAKLKDDMVTWVNVLGECDHFLGKSIWSRCGVSGPWQRGSRPLADIS
jgi:hypothetical protein